MKGRRHSPEQIVRKLREADRLLAEGADVDAVCRHLEVSVQTYQRWRARKGARDLRNVGFRASRESRDVACHAFEPLRLNSFSERASSHGRRRLSTTAARNRPLG